MTTNEIVKKLTDVIAKTDEGSFFMVSEEFGREIRNELINLHAYKVKLDDILALPNCQTCGRRTCISKPEPGEYVVFNCPSWIKKEDHK